MRTWIRGHGGTLALAGLVLVVAMASSATAALVITGKDIKNNTVTTKDVKNGSLKSADLAAKTRAELQGAPAFVGGACTIPGPLGGPGTIATSVGSDGVITLICSTPPVSAADIDSDGDGFKRSQECNDIRPMVNPAAVEVNGNYYDDDCDGAADDQLDSADHDGDLQGINQGDCDDTDIEVKAGGPDTFGNGVDNNCDGVDGIAS